jgi:hypothetical protein
MYNAHLAGKWVTGGHVNAQGQPSSTWASFDLKSPSKHDMSKAPGTPVHSMMVMVAAGKEVQGTI